ncbi:MAG TPA: carbonic anhydrase [Polyangiaceae bacterium]|jgi:carbonic anhydrase|nr:carbonic anhydrase [Polyangiaceae bacterium]
MSQIETLTAGFRRFRDESPLDERLRFRELVDLGQKPRTLFLGCCDSRVDPALITCSQPGELFVVRNIANVVPSFGGDEKEAAAALEFSVNILGVEDIVIMGHSRCAGIHTALAAARGDVWPDGPLHGWLRAVEGPARETLELDSGLDPADQLCACGRRSLMRSIERLREYPWVKDSLSKNRVALHAWFFSLGRMQLEALNQQKGVFEVIA